ncbi:MAG TPA: heme o synthase [Longilinea sp.]|nr:heme o synthase [Longilinea sp.]
MKTRIKHFRETGRYWILAAAILMFLVIVVGNVTRVSNAAAACPDWPTCFGQLSFPAERMAQIALLHRLLSAAALITTAVALGGSFAHNKANYWVTRPLAAGLVVLILQIALGAGVVLFTAPSVLAAIHLGLALLTFALTLIALIAAFILKPGKVVSRIESLRVPFNRLTLATTLAVFLLLLSGAIVSFSNTGSACSGWPLCGGGFPATGAGWLAFIHRIITLAAAFLISVQFFYAWRGQRSQPVQLSTATGVMVLMFGEVLVGAVKVQRGFPADLVGLHAASSAALWGVQIILTAAAFFSGRSTEQEREESQQSLPGFKLRARDFLMLNKPIIVLLLLVTTYAGMVVGGKTLPGIGLTVWTMIGGALAAGGASALNQYIDRELDKRMQRTAKRPLPSGRLTPAEGLAYGLAACLLAFFLMASFVNLLAAILSLAGMIYYVLLYSIWLKHATVQNIVIGGGAGAIPPLVGWAAATGSLNVPSLFLFALVFLWTPAHFWALALVRQNDYARGGVPMLPVVKGEHETRKQIFIYTLELVALTLLMPLVKISGSVFLVSAVLLGLWLLRTAYRVLRQGGNKNAHLMYRYSSMYLAFIFLAMVIDALV